MAQSIIPKNLAADVAALNSKFVWETVAKSSDIESIPANNVKDNDITITKSGYTPIGILGWNVGSGGPKLGCVYVRIVGITGGYVARMRLINVDSSAKAPDNISVSVLYVKN